MAKKKSANPWILHLTAVRKANPGMKLSAAMKLAKKSYVKKK